jgi:NTP pyrophosphatase (non-canonical NTP hydrolase)
MIMGEYVNSGKLISHVDDKITLIARAEDSEKAHFLATAANQFSAGNEAGPVFDYVTEATLTLSNKFHGELVGRERFEDTLSSAIDALAELDLVKKSLFYGKDNFLKGKIGHENCFGVIHQLVNEKGLAKPDAENLVHGIVGLATEAGELLELLYDTLQGKPLDLTNLKEEVGDGKWYMAILAKVGGFMWGDDEKVNIAKLRKRFPNAFTEHDANNRNLAAERVILEGDGENQLPLNIE